MAAVLTLPEPPLDVRPRKVRMEQAAIALIVALRAYRTDIAPEVAALEAALTAKSRKLLVTP